MAPSVGIRTLRAAGVAGFALFAALTLLADPASGASSFANLWLYNGLMVLACALAISRAVVVEHERAAWVAFSAGLVSWTFGEIWFAAVHPETYPSVADLGFIGFYPLAYAGIVLLLRSRARTIGGALWLDGITASLAAGAVAAALLVEMVLAQTEGSRSTVVTNLAYPLGDLLLLSAVFGVFSLARWRPGRRWLVLGLGLLATAVADAVYLFQSAEGTYVEGTWLDVLWPAAMLLVACAAWVGHDRSERFDVDGRPLLAVPAAGALTGIGVLVYDHVDQLNELAIALSTATLLAVVVRLVVTFRENRRLYELTRDEAVTDSLTGLGNRRRLMRDLDAWYDERNADPVLLMILDLDGFKGYNDTFGHPAGDALLARLAGKLATVLSPPAAAYRLGGDEFCVVAPIGDEGAEALIDRACTALTEHGEGFQVESSFGAVLLPDEATNPSAALNLADERLYAQKHTRRPDAGSPVPLLLETISARDPELHVSLESTAQLAVETGRRLGLRPEELVGLEHAAQLHDLGMIAVPEEILAMPGALDEREWSFIRQHTVVGERILRASPALWDVAAIVRSVHERFAGGGYPDGLVGEDIPLAARIVAACDAYTAMTSARPYRPALSPDEALAELDRCAGTQFDPMVVRVLVAEVRERLEAEHAA